MTAPAAAGAARFEAKTLPVRDLDYRVAVAGDPAAPVVLLVHGFAGAGDDWSRTAAVLAAAGYRAVAPDLPGHGGTPAPRDRPLERYAAAETARDLLALLETIDAPEAHWVGYSMGGRIALLAALEAPARVRTLTLEGASPGLPDAADRAERLRADRALADEIETRGAAWFAEQWAARPMWATQRALPAETRAAVAARRRRNDPVGLADSLRAAGQGAQPYVGDRLAGFSRPMLLITGALDAKYTTLAASMAAPAPSALHVAIPDAGHNVHLERPDWFERTLLTHLRRHGGATSRSASPTP